MQTGTRELAGRGHPTRAELHAFVDRERSPARHLRIARHLSGCATCADVVRSVRECAAHLEALDVPPPSDQLVSRVLARIADLPVPRRHLRIVAPAGLVVAAALAVSMLPAATRALRGISRWAQPPTLPSAEISELLLWVVAATRGGLGRAMDGLLAPVARIPAVGSLPWLLPVAAAVGLAATLAAATLWLMLRRLYARVG
jgi:anti-sigma factor RsiW